MRSLSFLSYALVLAVAPSISVAKDFQKVCRNIRVGGINMSTSCPNGKGGWTTNGVNMGDCIGVSAAGALQCGCVPHISSHAVVLIM